MVNLGQATSYGISVIFPDGVGYQLNINRNINISSIPSYVFNNVGTIYIPSGITLTIDQYTILPPNISGIAGPGSININSGITLVINSNINCTISTISGAGTLTINPGYTLTFSGNNLIPSGLNANGALALSGNYTLGTNITNGTGNLIINSGYTLTVSSNLTLGFSSIGGSGTLTISSGYTLTQGNNLTLNVPTINLNGTWANNSYRITVDPGITQTWYVSGSLTTGTTPGILNTNGMVFYYGNGIGVNTSNVTTQTLPTFPLKFSGTGIFIGCPTSTKGTSTNALSLPSSYINPGQSIAIGYFMSGIPYMTFTSITGSAIGTYGIGLEDMAQIYYYIWILIYLGSTSTYTIPSGYYWNYTTTPMVEGDAAGLLNTTGSAGSIKLSGTAYT